MTITLCYCGHSLASLGPGSDGTHSEDDNSCFACGGRAPCLDHYELVTVARFDTAPAAPESWRPRHAETLSGRVIFP